MNFKFLALCFKEGISFLQYIYGISCMRGSQNFDPSKWGDRKISGALISGDHKI